MSDQPFWLWHGGFPESLERGELILHAAQLGEGRDDGRDADLLWKRGEDDDLLLGREERP